MTFFLIAYLNLGAAMNIALSVESIGNYVPIQGLFEFVKVSQRW